MGLVLNDVGAYLVTRGLGTLGTNLYIGTMPDTPAACGALYEYGGLAPDGGLGAPGVQFEHPAIQVVFRGAPNDYAGPRAKAETAFRALAAVQPGPLPGVGGSAEYLVITPNQSPFLLQKDTSSRVWIACNYICDKEADGDAEPFLGPLDFVALSIRVGRLGWLEMPLASTEIFEDTAFRAFKDLSDAEQARLAIRVEEAGAAGARLAVQYSLDGLAWAYLDGASGLACLVDAAGIVVSAWAGIAAAALADVQLRIVGSGGNGVTTPVFGIIEVQVR